MERIKRKYLVAELRKTLNKGFPVVTVAIPLPITFSYYKCFNFTSQASVYYKKAFFEKGCRSSLNYV